MAFGTPIAGFSAYSAANGTSVAPPYPSPIASTDQLILIIGQKPSTANGGTVTTPTGWTLRDSLTAAGGYGNTLGADTGNTNLFIYTKDTVSGTETGSLSVTLGTSNVAWARIVAVPTNGGPITYGSSDGSDTTAGSVSVTLAADPGLTAGDFAIWAMCIPTDVGVGNQFSAHAISATGATFATPIKIAEPFSSNGNDIGGFVEYSTVSAGTATAAPTITATASGTTTNVRGPLVLLRLRETLRTGTMSVSETGADTAAAAGKVLIKGTSAVTEAGSDTAAASGKVTVKGALSVSETGADTASASGRVITNGSLSVTEAGDDALSATGAVLVKGSLAGTETGVDAFSSSGKVLVQGTLVATETGADTLSAAGSVLVQGSLAASETGADAFSGSGKVIVQGALAGTETGHDTFIGVGGNQVAGIMAATETGTDAFNATGSVLVQGSLAASETGADVFAATGSTGAAVTGVFAATETGLDGFRAVGLAGKSWADQNARAYGKKKRTRDYVEVDRGENVDWAKRALIDEEDEIVLAVVMAAAPLLGVHAWRQ